MTNQILHFWQEESYYKISQEASYEKDHLGMQKLYNLAQKSRSILDLGCGEGTRLKWLINNRNIKAVGVDISPLAIKLAKRNGKKIKFLEGDIGNPQINGQYDLVYSAFTLEHLRNPAKMIESAISLTKHQGSIVIMAPNFGAPNRASPNNRHNRFIKLIKGFQKDVLGQYNLLSWQKVEPCHQKYTNIDDDTLIEPYIMDLIKYLLDRGLKIITYSSLWNLEAWSLNPRKTILKLLGSLNLPPFKYWGPQILVIAQK